MPPSPHAEPSQHSPCVVRVDHHDGRTVLQVRGELDVLSAPQLQHATTATGSIEIDLSRCTFLDAAGLRAIAEMAAAHPPGLLRVVGPDRFRRELIERCGMGHLLDGRDLSR